MHINGTATVPTYAQPKCSVLILVTGLLDRVVLLRLRKYTFVVFVISVLVIAALTIIGFLE